MNTFALPIDMPEDIAKERLGKAIHLSEEERAEVWAAYLASRSPFQPAAPSPGQGFAKNPIPWTQIGMVSQARVLAQVAAKEITPQEAAQLLASSGGVKIRYNPATGTISLKGGGQYPWASLYRDQWEKLFAGADDIRAYIDLNGAEIEAAEAVGKASKAAAKAA